ncbi:hypothetical protein N0V90_000348 [Kalmusia sp. IMI 367209]|nr:hypothetical protein N0V90_000348 [Kalmusia sp. IMI 367209]
MPTYRSISIALHSQFDIQPYPEYLPRPQSYYVMRGVTPAPPVPAFVDEKTSTCSVYVPVYPGSQFWIRYSVLPPVPNDQQFLFKFYINGAHVVSWSTGKKEKWEGKMMFALFEGEDAQGKKRIEKRALYFTPPDGKGGKWSDVCDPFDEEAHLEIRVHRALGKKRVARQVEDYEKTEHGTNERGISLMNAGRAGSEQPKRFYKYALIDPIDRPFATFRYYYRTWDQIYELGLSKDEIFEAGEVTELPVIEPYEAEDSKSRESKDSDEVAQEFEDIFQSNYDAAGECSSSPPRTYVPTGIPRAHAPDENSDEHERTPTRRSSRGTPTRSYRLCPTFLHIRSTQVFFATSSFNTAEERSSSGYQLSTSSGYPRGRMGDKNPESGAFYQGYHIHTNNETKERNDAHRMVERNHGLMAAPWNPIELLE